VLGLEVCRRLRRRPETANVPIIMLTARGEESDRIRGLETGADDYVTKPFSPRELVARVGAVLRRVRPALAGERLSYGDVEMDVTAHRVRRGGTPIALGPTEFRLLKYFLEHPGRVFSRERLLDAVWSHDPDIDLRTVDVHVRRLRKALNDDGRDDVIRTVRSAGYALDSEG
jgi:two-component system phosphate regulon response regulator PhoB